MLSWINSLTNEQRQRADNLLFARGWSRSKYGLWYRPFPENNKAGVRWFEAIELAGITVEDLQ